MAVTKESPILWNLTPCSVVKSTHVPACFILLSRLTYCGALKMEAMFYSQTSVDFYQTKRRCITEDRKNCSRK
jgi:hypothetical protein